MLHLILTIFVGLTVHSSAVEKTVALDERDGKVIEAALLHLMMDPHFRLLRGEIPDAQAQWLLNVNGPRFGWTEPLVMKHKAPADLIEVSRERSRKATDKALTISYTGLKMPPQIAIANPATFASDRNGFREFRDTFPKARGWASINLPAFSNDGNRALVHGEIGPTAHGSQVVFLLELHDGKWTVKWFEGYFQA